MAGCSEVALFEKTFVIFKIKSIMYLRRFRLSLEGTKAYFDTVYFYTAVARLGFKRRATAVLKSNLIRLIEFGTAVARRLKRA